MTQKIFNRTRWSRYFYTSFSAVKRRTFNAPTFRSEVLQSNVSRKCDYAERTLRIDVRF